MHLLHVARCECRVCRPSNFDVKCLLHSWRCRRCRHREVQARGSGIEASRFDARCWLLHVHVAPPGNFRVLRAPIELPARGRGRRAARNSLLHVERVPDSSRAPVRTGGHHRPLRGSRFPPLCHALAARQTHRNVRARGDGQCDEEKVNMRPSRLHRPSLVPPFLTPSYQHCSPIMPATYDPSTRNVFAGPNSLVDYFNPDKNAPLPLVELPPQLNPYYDDGVRIYAKMLTALPATNVKSLPGKFHGARSIAEGAAFVRRSLGRRAEARGEKVGEPGRSRLISFADLLFSKNPRLDSVGHNASVSASWQPREREAEIR